MDFNKSFPFCELTNINEIPFCESNLEFVCSMPQKSPKLMSDTLDSVANGQ